MTTKCPKCDWEIKPGIQFCGNCGEYISSGSLQRELVNFVLPNGTSSAPLAWRSERGYANLVDGLFFVPHAICVAGMAKTNTSFEDLPVGLRIFLFVSAFIILMVQGIKLTKSGQTIGKQYLKIRIVRISDGKNGGFWVNCILRVIPVVTLDSIPYVGELFGLIDILFIFKGKLRRCIHDLIAGTCVIKD